MADDTKQCLTLLKKVSSVYIQDILLENSRRIQCATTVIKPVFDA